MPPLWLDRASCLELDPPEELGALAVHGRHVVLRFATHDAAAMREAIDRLQAALPDHSVFLSGVDTITVLRVLDRAEIERHRAAIAAAIADYRRTCAALVEHYRAGTLDPAWDAGEHGLECRFEHRETGQLVEAPFTELPELPRSGRVDPYFFELFVKSTPAWREIAALMATDYHDAARMLEVAGDP
jgi:hypothetical protein